MRSILLQCLVFFLPTMTLAEPQSINLIELKTDQFQTWEAAHRKSDSAPLTIDELQQLSQAGIGESTCMELIRTRGVLGIADAETMIKLKKAGYSDAMIAQFSAYAVKPNQGFDIDVTLTLSSADNVTEAPFAYLELWSDKQDRQEAFFYADLRQVRGQETESRHDRVLKETASTIRRRLHIPTRQYGPMTLRFATSQEANFTSLKTADAAHLRTLQDFTFDYPGASLEHHCVLNIELSRDRVLKDSFTLRHSDWHCHWE